MLNFGLFVVFSVIETFAMFFFGFKLFKIDIYPKEMIFAGAIMAFFSYIIRANNQWVEVDIIIQYGLMFCFYWLLFRTHLFYAAILTGITYQAYSFIQLVYIFLLNRIGNFSSHTFYGMEISTYVMQLLTSCTAIIIGYYIGRKRKGFDFIPDKPDGTITPSKREILMFILNLPTAAIIISITHLYNSDYFYTVPLIYGFLLFCYIYLSYKKDRSGHEYLKL
ncbi:hypothetical protein C2I18_02485 [Paenibacillus sp. PK3_47]|uniref:hypothetical protein n=1 Tax=Paenibacillus sp. PK3_47 TaxID=2072642 RepID=UPI00201D91CE|nr:hypothetical protein [Paenibacillus sp. PK3_47]UQZ32521.1 hypothetical protein C2I18_02485 [Paenibacillus sp. PK3_47]